MNEGDEDMGDHEQSRIDINNNMNGDGEVQENQLGETSACYSIGIVNKEYTNEQSKFVTDNVVNISDRVLTQAEWMADRLCVR